MIKLVSDSPRNSVSVIAVKLIQSTTSTSYKQLEAIQRWSAICRVWPWTLTYQKFLLCISSQGQDLYTHTKN